MQLFRRNQDITTLEYIYLTVQRNFSYSSFITMPDGFNSAILNFVRILPSNFVQIFNPQIYFTIKCNEITNSSLNFSVLYFRDLNNYLKQINSSNIRIFIIDNNSCKNIDSIYEKVSKLSNVYLTILDYKEQAVIPKKPQKNSGIFFRDAEDLLSKIKTDKDAIINKFNANNKGNILDINHIKKIVKKDSNNIAPMEKIPVFRGAHPNFFVKNQMNSNIWIYKNNVDHSEEFLKKKRKEFLLGVDKDRSSFPRLSLLLKQIVNIDNIHQKSILPTQVNDIEPTLKPLIITLPFHNPQENQLAKIFNIDIPQDIKKFLQVEQDRNYLFNMGIPDKFDNNRINEFRDTIISSINKVLYPRLQYLDFITYLHSSFTLSPILRLPFLGKSIKKELAFLKPNTKNNLKGVKLNKTIKRFGLKLKESVIEEDLENYLSNRDGQIVVISDLPIEWLDIKRLPLSFTHDICRIPETDLRKPIMHYTLNSNFQYIIPKNIRDKTLVILGSSEDEVEFQLMNNVVEKECKKLKIKTAKCKSISSFISLLKEIKPELLIIDCHGDFEQETLSSYLLINGEKLTAEIIIKNKIQIPLIFLSACTSNPVYGFVNSIANAFFLCGSFSVSTTFLPISIINGSLTYLRLLMHLNKVAINGDFPNWLSYISHITRTAMFSDIVFRFLKKRKKYSDNILSKLDEIKDKTVSFSSRRATFEHMNKQLNNLDKDLRVNFESLIHESLLYSHLGRSDLIPFQSWVDRKIKKII